MIESPSETTTLPPWIRRLLWTVSGFIVGLFVLFHVARALRGLIITLIISLFISIALEPAVNYLERRGWKRGLATGAAFVTFLFALGMLIGLMVPLIVDQALRFIDRLPGYIDRLGETASNFGLAFTGDRLESAAFDLQGSLQGVAGDLAGSIFGVGSALLATVFQLLTIALFTFYITAEGPRLRRVICSVLPPDRQREMLRMLDIAIDKTGGYFYSRALLALVGTLVGWIVFSIVGIPFPLALALWMSVLAQFVPVVGTYIGGALPLLIALLESPGKALAVLVYVVAYQLIENYLLAPRITARTMALHPAVAFGAALVGGTLLGAAGAIMALPAAATLQAFASTYIERHDVIDSHLTDLDSEK